MEDLDGPLDFETEDPLDFPAASANDGKRSAVMRFFFSLFTFSSFSVFLLIIVVDRILKIFRKATFASIFVKTRYVPQFFFNRAFSLLFSLNSRNC